MRVGCIEPASGSPLPEVHPKRSDLPLANFKVADAGSQVKYSPFREIHVSPEAVKTYSAPLPSTYVYPEMTPLTTCGTINPIRRFHPNPNPTSTPAHSVPEVFPTLS